ncbi:GMC family oxidoreductase [Frankia nepalensis]|uniref:GMC family oxidoreductase n=1 Tax=Frankia nepalensis TaxID=1836974 RepID=UPI001EE45765|nr:GMC family oxidoreductase [Frankia nepalensis]
MPTDLDRRTMPSGFDVIVVGGGTSGCIVARRFVDGGARVLLLEAGQDIDPDDVPSDISDLYPRSYYNPDYAWPGLQAQQQADPASPPSPFTQARVLGGGSALMGMVALRGLSADYESWSKTVPEWSTAEVERTFVRLEDDADFADERHGRGGPIAVRRLDRASWPAFVAALGAASERAGFRYIADFNTDDRDGFGPLPLSRTASSRVSSASAFLPGWLRAGGSPRVQSGVEVDQLLFSGSRCVGVRATAGGQPVTFHADRVVVCGGAVFTPLLLQRSGIGDANMLRKLGIEVVTPLGGVGENLQNHPVVYLATHIPRAARQPRSIRQGFIAGLRASSGIEGGFGDLNAAYLNKSSWHGLGESIGGLGVSLMAPRSRGSVRLAQAGSSNRPEILFNFLSDPVDRRRMQFGVELAAELLADGDVRKHRHEVFTAGYNQVVRALNAPGFRNAALTTLIAALLDGPGFGRRSMLRIGMSTGALSERRLRDPMWRERTMLAGTFGTYHVAGTCAMGPADDPEAVVDYRGDVIGLDGLTIADASIMRTIPRANTNLPVQMVAMRIADLQLNSSYPHPSSSAGAEGLT